ncbi:hypothetical protein GPALN_006942 [Globodera pallida]|nr:hypothetical protein GPALN_006942 [Globodera pallida]
MDINDSNINNTLYQMYRNVYPCWPFIISAVAINLVALFGMISNFGVIWVTYCTKTLHGTANFLIALCSFFELLHQQGHWLFLYTALSGQNFLPLTLAIRICTVSLFGTGGISTSMAFTGLDRLLCVLFPTFPRKVKPLPYLCVIILICMAFSALNVMVFYDSARKVPNLMVTGPYLSKTLISELIWYSVTIALYVIVGIVIKKRSAVSNSSAAEQTNRRIYRSILIIVLLNVGGYYLITVYALFIEPHLATTDPLFSWTITMFVSIVLVNVSAASNGPLSIGIDRLIGVIFPIWYKTNGKNVTFKFIIVICCIRSILNGFSAYIGSSANWEKPVMCTFGDPSQQPENQNFTNISAFIIYCGEFLCYALIWLIMWGRKSTIPENMKKLTISLSILMSIGLICYILNIFFARVIMPLINLDAFTIEYFVFPICIVLHSIAYGSNALVLYFCNAQYRSAFRTQFGHQSNQVTPIIEQSKAWIFI